MIDAKELRDIAIEQTKRCVEYAEARGKAGRAKVALDMLLAAGLKGIRANKPNVGIDLAYIILCEPVWLAGTDQSEAARSFYAEWQEQESVYKGLERVIDAYQSRIMMEMALMKHQQIGERHGA